MVKSPLILGGHVCCRAIERDDDPLKSRSTLEAEHLGTYIHPIFRESCHRFAHGTVWRSEEIAADYSVRKEKADGIAVVKNRDDLPIGYFEGARPVPRKGKTAADGEKVLSNELDIKVGRDQLRPDILITTNKDNKKITLAQAEIKTKWCSKAERTHRRLTSLGIGR
ncbi:hypothetical protein HDU86_002832 [Geranomyces michiganensis]|nr:hypothetical protein HDU86_002832 [Geranomyces michiganensis]